MKVPQVRARLRVLAVERDMPELASLADDLRRRSPVRRAARQSRPMTPALREEIRAFAAANPKMSFRKIGEHFDVVDGRVSEAVAGRRT